MKLLFFTLTFWLFTGCASYHEKQKSSAGIPRKDSQREKGSQNLGKGAVWELISPEKLVLHFKNVESDLTVGLIMNKGINSHLLNSGHWELIGLDHDGISYKAMNVSKKFVLKIRSGVQIYSGSLLLGCPRASKKETIFLKKMKFFDRYPFSSTYGLCELIIGDNREEVQKRLFKHKKIRTLNLQSGF